MGRRKQGGWMVESCILPVTEPFGKWVVINFQLSYLGVLIGSDCYKLGVWYRDDDLLLTSWL